MSTVQPAGATPAFVRKPKIRNVRTFMFAYQAHAWEDLRVKLGRIKECHGFPPAEDDYKAIPCPLCGKACEAGDLSIEHVPQQGGQSTFGATAIKVLTCGGPQGCNNTANDLYERLVANENDRIALAPTSMGHQASCQIHGTVGWHQAGMVIPPNDDARFMTDLKSGFLLAFATLGYRFALADELAPVRDAIRTGKRPRPEFAVMAKFPADGRAVVMDIAAPWRSVVVKAADGTALILPTVGAPRLPFTPKQLRRGELSYRHARTQEIPWPTLQVREGDIEVIFRAGRLFHYDHCKKHLPGYW